MDIIEIVLLVLIVLVIFVVFLLIKFHDSLGDKSGKWTYVKRPYEDAPRVPRGQSNGVQNASVAEDNLDSQSSDSVLSESTTENGVENNSNLNGNDGDVGKKITHKQQSRQQKKEEKALKKAEEARRREELAEEARKRNFNPKLSIPTGVKFTSLAVSGGHLVPSSIGQTSYYRCWEYEGAFYYEFYCEPSKAPKAFNNRSVILDPFCQKDNDSVSVDSAKTFTTLEYGVMDSNFNIISKSLVKFE